MSLNLYTQHTLADASALLLHFELTHTWVCTVSSSARLVCMYRLLFIWFEIKLNSKKKKWDRNLFSQSPTKRARIKKKVCRGGWGGKIKNEQKPNPTENNARRKKTWNDNSYKRESWIHVDLEVSVQGQSHGTWICLVAFFFVLFAKFISLTSLPCFPP